MFNRSSTKGYQMKNLTLLDKVLNAVESKKFERGLYFVAFVVAPIYIVGHIVVAFIQGRI